MEKKTEEKAKEIVVTRKVPLFVMGPKEEVNRAYAYIRNGQEVQAQMSNMYITALYEAKRDGASKDEINAIGRTYAKVPASDNIYSGIIDPEKYPTGLAVTAGMGTEVRAKLDKAFKDGLKYGRVSLPTFRSANPVYVQGKLLLPECDSRHRGSKGFRHSYNTYEELENALLKDAKLEKDGKPSVWLDFANGFVFGINFGNPHKSRNLRLLFCRIFSGEYKICDSSIRVKENKIELLLAIKQPIEEHFRDENVSVGVDLGIAVPAVCALNNNLYKREMVGNADELIGFRMKKRKMYERLQSNLKYSKGGHGRKKKLKKLDNYNSYISNYAKTYNHKLSKAVVDFAVKNNAAYINLEDLSGIKESGKKAGDGEADKPDKQEERRQFMLRNWSLYDLQKDIEYKAEREGIKVRYINPMYTSQTCSVCGQRGIRPDQKTFTCLNPECKCKEIYEKAGNTMRRHFADFNAARNIAMSTDFVDAEGKKEKKAKKAKKEEKSA